MAPLSILPGRIRWEIPLLTGRAECCRYLEERVMTIQGVLDVSANQRTGRILIQFDEKTVTSSALTKHLEELTKDCKARCAETALPEAYCSLAKTKKAVRSGQFSHLTGDLLLNTLVHAVLPAPLDFILPTAVTLFQGSLAGSRMQGG
jgi:hypothetical protein